MSSSRDEIKSPPNDFDNHPVSDEIVAVQDKTGDEVTVLILNENQVDSEWIEADPDNIRDLEEER